MDLSLPHGPGQAGAGLSSTLASAATSARDTPNTTAPGTPQPQKLDQDEAEFMQADLDDIHAATLAGSLSSVHLSAAVKRVGSPNPGAGVATTTQSASPARPPPPARSNSGQDAPAKPAKPELEKKKSMFGKLFDRANQSSTNLASAGPQTPASERMDRADSAGTTNSNPPSIARRASGKSTKGDNNAKASLNIHPDHLAPPPPTNRHRSESQDTNRKRGESVGAKSDHGEKEKGNGMGAALNAFMQNKMSRKPSVTSRKSDDGLGESQYGGSQKSGKGSEKGSRAGGASSASLLKKYGVCEKVVIGKGATAVVKLAHKWDRSTERLYAVKEFRKRRKNETEKEYVKKLTSEFCISSTLHHHNVVETVDLVQDEQQHWCEVMEYCPGGDLYAAIKKGDMGSPAISSYFKQILCGISYLHSMGVAHRDIKPENLLLDAHGHVKITDFGVSDVFRMCWEKTTHLSKGLCGSEPYIAPEQFEQKEYDARLVDVWACAVVLYCMHFQELPWRVAKLSDPSFGPYSQLYQSNPGHTAPPISNLVPRECRAIVRRMLDPDPKTRATTEEVLRDPWVVAIKVIPPRVGAPIDE